MKVLTPPTIRFTQKAFQQITALTKQCDIEISAMGVIATNEHKRRKGIAEDFYILEFHVPEQECSPTSTTIEAEALSELTFNLMKTGVKPEQICVWWHSHVNMDVSHSGVDEKQIESFKFDKVCISIITNKNGAINIRVDMYSPIRYSFEKCGYTINEISVLEDGWADDVITENVTEIIVKKFPQSWGGGYYPKSYTGNYTNTHGQNNYTQNYKGKGRAQLEEAKSDLNLLLGADIKEIEGLLEEDTPASEEDVVIYEEDVSDQPKEIQDFVEAYYEGNLSLSELLTITGEYFAEEEIIEAWETGDRKKPRTINDFRDANPTKTTKTTKPKKDNKKKRK